MDMQSKIIKLDRSDKMNTTLEREPKTLDCVIKIRKLARKSMNERGLTEEEVERRAREYERKAKSSI